MNQVTIKKRIIDPHKPQATKADIADHFHVTIRTVDNWMSGKPPIPFFRRRRAIRFKIAEVEEHFKSQEAVSN